MKGNTTVPVIGDTGHFDRSAQTWDNDPVKHHRAQAVAEGIRRRITPTLHLRAMDYGCGTGLLGFALQGDFGRIDFADTSPGMLAILDRKIAAAGVSHLRSRQLDLLNGPLPPERYDVIFSLMTLHHIDDTAGILARLYELLETPGYLCIADLDAEDGSFHETAFDGHCGFDRSSLQRLSEQAGFRNVGFSTVFKMNRPSSPGQSEFPIFLMVALK